MSEKQAKIQDYNCVECGKHFNSYTIYHNHLKNKHSPGVIKTTAVDSPKKDAEESVPQAEVKAPKNKSSSKNMGKSKGFEQYQQDLEDKIYALLGELGEKHVQASKQSENLSEESDRMMGQANYLQNNVVRTPFELEFEIKKQIPQITIENPALQQLFKIFEKDTVSLHQKLLAEKDIWQLRDPIEMDKYEQEEFSLINIANVLNNYPKKDLALSYPEMCVFLLWLGKICKPAVWKEFYVIVGYTIFQFIDYLSKAGTREKSQQNWKTFTTEHTNTIAKGIPEQINELVTILDEEDVASFLKLYYKWVTFFDLF